MRAPDVPDALTSALDDLAVLAGPADAPALDALRDRLRRRGCGCWSWARPSGARARW